MIKSPSVVFNLKDVERFGSFLHPHSIADTAIAHTAVHAFKCAAKLHTDRTEAPESSPSNPACDSCRSNRSRA